LIPDFVFSLHKDGETPFFAGEFHRRKNTREFIKKLYKYRRALMAGSLTDKYLPRLKFNGDPRNPRILCVFELESLRNAVAKRILTDSYLNDGFQRLLAFATLEDVISNPRTAFKTLDNEPFTI